AVAAVEDVEARVRRDPVQPRPHRGPSLEPAHTLPGAQEGLLDQVLRLLERAEYPVAVHPQLTTVTLHKRGERRLVARPRRGQDPVFLARAQPPRSVLRYLARPLRQRYRRSPQPRSRPEARPVLGGSPAGQLPEGGVERVSDA